jgi:homoserine dehydrogenase
VRFDLILVGFGNVARRFVELLDEQRTALRRDFDVSTRVVGVVTRHAARLASPGSAALGAAPHSESHDRRGTARSQSRSTTEFIRRATRAHRASARGGRLVVVESTTLNVVDGRPGIDHVRAALAGGAHVITVNKGPAAFAYRLLTRAAARAKRRFLFEGAVMDGVPIFNLARESMPAVRITGFRGIVNTTTNFMLSAMERGERFDDALAAMQRAGIAEADATLDVDGWDAAAKVSALANVLMDARITPHDVHRRGINAAIARRADAALKNGRRMKLVAEATRRGTRVVARVGPRILDDDDFLTHIDGRQNALVLTTDLLGDIAVVQRGSGLTQTAYALLSDLLAIARDVRR